MNALVHALKPLKSQSLGLVLLTPRIVNSNKVVVTCVQNYNTTHLELTDRYRLKKSREYRREVHYPEDGKYTVKPLRNTHLAGRDKETGRLVVKGLGGGIKHKYHWIDNHRVGPKDDSPPVIEKVIQIMKCGCRTPNIALVGVEDRLKYIIASVNMKAGDLLKTSMYIPRIPVLAEEGDAYPIGALPLGSVVYCVEMHPGGGGFYCRAAGTYATLTRRVGERVIVQLPSKYEYALDQHCMATVGRASNIEHDSIDVGTLGWRYAGNRSRSGLWQRKGGRCGRKLTPLPPVKYIEPPSEEELPKLIKFTKIETPRYEYRDYWPGS